MAGRLAQTKLPMQLVELRVRSRTPQDELDRKLGKIVTPKDYNLLLTGPTRVVAPAGQPLLIYLPRAIPAALNATHYPTLHGIKGQTDNRGLASGSRTIQLRRQRRANQVASTIIGNFDRAGGRFPYCRTTAWTGKNTEQFRALYPLFQHIAAQMQTYVPARYAVQMAEAERTHPDWRVGDTPFTTMTVNNTYPTGVHVDKGDLDEGFSCLAVWRRGQYAGGHLTFPEWRLAIDLQDGDLVLMDAHQWHGNTAMELLSEDAERISLVLYYRTRVKACGSEIEERQRELAIKTKNIKAGVDSFASVACPGTS
jgi:hypothetical protein